MVEFFKDRVGASSDLRIVFPSHPAFRQNHGILTPSIIGRVTGPDNWDVGNAYFPCHELDSGILAGRTVDFTRLARSEGTYYVDTRDFDEIWLKLPPRYRPANYQERVYMLPAGGPNTDAASIRNLIVADFTRSAHDVISDYVEQQEEQMSPGAMHVDLGDNPFVQAVILAQDLDLIMAANPQALLPDLVLLHEKLDPVVKRLRGLDHLQTMRESAKNYVLGLPPDKVWAALELVMRQNRSADKGGSLNSVFSKKRDAF